MNNTPLMQVLQAFDHLPTNKRRAFLRKLLLHLHQLVQLPTQPQLLDEVNVLMVVEDAVKLDYVGVGAGGLDLYLAEELVVDR